MSTLQWLGLNGGNIKGNKSQTLLQSKRNDTNAGGHRAVSSVLLSGVRRLKLGCCINADLPPSADIPTFGCLEFM